MSKKKKQKNLKHFRRIWKYVWPQWFRLSTVIMSAILIGILFSLSFATIIPLLKVMMGEEGLHGWIDRKVCDWRYGMDFYIPDSSDFLSEETRDIAYYIRVIDVDEEGQAYKAGIQELDQIVDINQKGIEEADNRISSEKLKQMLATADDGTEILVTVKRSDSEGKIQKLDLKMKSLKHPDNIPPEEMSFSDRYEWGFRHFMIKRIYGIIDILPRGDIRTNKERSIMFIILAMGVVTMVRCMATFYQKYQAEKIVQISIAGLREEFFDHVMYMPAGYFSSEGTSDTISRILGDVSGTGKGVKILLGKALREPLKALFCLLLAMLISWKLTLIFLCAAPVTIGLLGFLGRKIKKATKRSLIATAIMLGKLQDSINALRVVKVYNRQEQEIITFKGINRSFLRRALRIARIQAATGPVMEILGMIAGSAALLVGAHWVCSNNMDGSEFLGLLVILGTSAESVRKASDVWNKVQEANASAERVFEVVDSPLEYEENDAVDLLPLANEIVFKDITFTYPKAEGPVLRGINLTVKVGQTVAVVGSNGSGKTTLINLIPRFYDPDKGQVLIDGTDIKKVSIRSLRDQIGMVTQNVATFNNTVAFNIGYGKPDATEQEIIDAARMCHVHEFIEPLPDGYDTVIGEHGSGFSGGQLQRIVIARAVLKNPSILIFDEAMSQIDAESEAKINDAISKVMKGRTSFVIAHRFSTVVSADSIVVVDAGKIIAQGRHEELIQTCEVYKNLYETQLMAPQ